jgi:SAM-dependent methyltransferase
VGIKLGQFAKREFVLRRCTACCFSFVEEPWLDFARIYDSAYYEGRGADPLVDYGYELAKPERTIRRYEWEGVLEVVQHLTHVTNQTRWLDFGCGNGGLVRYANSKLACDVVGFEEGAITEQAKAVGVPVLTANELERENGSFDVVTAIEVLEHVVQPLDVLTKIRRLLRPGGVFFYTTGNAEPQRGRLLQWQYFIPEIHISLYEPATMERALRDTGFAPRHHGYIPGWDRIVAFKVLKNLRRRITSPFDRAVPWRQVAPLINARFGLYDFPLGYAV